MLKIGALWFRKSNKGVPFFSGILDTNELPAGGGDKIRFVIFKNNMTTSEKSPTHIMYFSEPSGGGGTGYSEKKKDKPPNDDNFFGDNDSGQDPNDIPF